MEKTIFDNIIDWSTERNIITAGKPSGQVLKVMEEMGEIAGGVARNKLALIKDAVGDVLVIMTNVAKMYGVEPSSVITFDEEERNLYPSGTGTIGLIADMYCYWGEAFTLVENHDVERDFTDLDMVYYPVLNVLFEISRRYNFTLQEAIEASYNEIKDRQGIFYNDVFVKEADFTLDWVSEVLSTGQLSDSAFSYLKKWAGSHVE